VRCLRPMLFASTLYRRFSQSVTVPNGYPLTCVASPVPLSGAQTQIAFEAEGVDHIVSVNRANLDELAKPLCRYICN